MLWHQRLGHIGEKGLRLLHGKGMVEGMSNCSLDFDFCEHCLYGKQNRVRFPSGATRAEGILQLVHNDVFGPVSVPSLGKCMYYVSFIDDSRRKLGYIFSGRNLKSLTGLRSLHYCIWVKFRRRVRRNCHFLLSEDRQTSDPLKRRFT
jgi:hypothetical protein